MLNIPRPAPGSDDFQLELVALMPRLRVFSQSLCHRNDLADDLTQETLLKAWRARASFQTGSNLKAWLFTIMRNCYYSQRRRKGPQISWDSDAAEQVAGPANAQEMTMELSDTLRALSSLAPHHRNSVVLVGVGGLSYENAAKLCGTPIGTMKSRVRRGREALLSALDVPKVSFEIGPRAIDAADDLMAQLAALMYPEAHVGGHA